MRIYLEFSNFVFLLQNADDFLVNNDMNSDTIFPIHCGKCPIGYYGNGMQCKPKCTRLRCKQEIEYCSAPDTCTRMQSTLIILKIEILGLIYPNSNFTLK